MRPCVESDFSERGIITVDKSYYAGRMCSDVKDKMYKVQNDYSNKTLRNSFSIEILTCSEFTSKECKSEAEIEYFLDRVFFTTYSLESYTNFDGEEKSGSAKPYRT